MSGEFADLMLGYYGQPLGERDPAVVALAEQQAKKSPITCRPADLLKPEWQELRSKALELPGNNGSDEDVLTYAMFPQVAPKFFASRDQGPRNLGKDPNATPETPPGKPAQGTHPVLSPVTYDVKLNGHSHRVSVTPVA
jgi:methylmalonyl-CoA carboxyltransferase 5S subunit